MRPNRELLAALLLLTSASLVVVGCAEGRSIPEPPNSCGDGRRGGDEQCDDGEDNSDEKPGACRTDCRSPRCGDSIVDPGEDCDDGNEEEGDGCTASCKEGYVCGDAECSDDRGESCSVCKDDCCPCGDGVCSAGEVCGECQADCCPDCGNGTLDAGEGCDDGNLEALDGCGPACNDEDGVATCGNSLHEAGEACDDGNTVADDGCGPDCQLEYVCGDNVCETNVGETCVTCLSDCCPNCGDGIVNDFEECDGSIPAGTPTCQDECYPGGSPTCSTCLVDYSTCEGELPECGNGVIECGEVCDADDLAGLGCNELGYDGGQLRCSSTCEIDTNGCGDLLHYYFEDFDAGCPAGWTLQFPWQCGVPTGGPASATSPPNVLSTGLAGNYPDDQSYFVATAASPPFNLSLADNPTVAFQVWHDLESGYDAIQVQASTDGNNWTPLTQTTPPYDGELQGWDGASSGWVSYTASLLQYVGQAQVYVRFGLASDGSGTRAGAFIDDVIVAESCGNGVLDPGEACDGANLGGATCDAGTCGTPTCAPDCSAIDQDSCLVPDCGNGVRECDEICDEDDQDGATCDSLGYEGGDLGCTAACQRDVSDCGIPAFLLAAQGFETCPPAGWTLAGEWECGVPTSGPGAANSGARVLATDLDGNYENGWEWNECYAETPQFVVSGPSPVLAFFAWMRTESSWDGMHVEVSAAGGPFQRVDDVSPAYTDDTVGGQLAWDDDLTSWQRYLVDLSAFSGQSIRVRFAFYSDSSTVYPGVYVDDVVAVADVAQVPFSITTPLPNRVFTLPGLSVDLDASTAADLTWSIVDETNAGWLTIDPATGVLSGTPDEADVGAASVTVRAATEIDPGNFAEREYDFTVVSGVYGEDFELCGSTGFTINDVWECGAPTSGPPAAHGGARCLGTNGYPNYVDWGEAVATSPSISLVNAASPTLTFWIYQDVEANYDGSRVEISVDDGAWNLLATTPGTTGTLAGLACWEEDITPWTQVTADLTPFAGQQIRLRWSLRSDVSFTYPGTFVDDVLIVD